MKKVIFIAIALLIAIEVVVLVFRFGSEPDEADTTAVTTIQPEVLPEPVEVAAGANGFPPSSDPPPTTGIIRTEFFGQDPIPLNFDTPVFDRQDDGRVLKKDVATRLEDLNNPDQEPIEDIQLLTSAVASYRQIFRENPIAGENREVVEALTGNNPYQLMLIDPANPAINTQNELIDRWNVPYRFHAVSRDYMEIQSAGADRQFGTGDDVMSAEPVEIGPSYESFENTE